MQLLESLRNVNIDRLDMDEIVAALTFANAMAMTYQSVGLETPEWLVDSTDTLKREAGARHRDQLEKELREIEQREETLKSQSEKRADLSSKKKRIMAQLGRV
jgi:hypothetical protein